MNKLNRLMREAQDFQKELNKLHSDRDEIYNNWQYYGMSKIGGVDAQDYLTDDIIKAIMDGISVKIRVLDEKLKELEGRIN